MRRTLPIVRQLEPTERSARRILTVASLAVALLSASFSAISTSRLAHADDDPSNASAESPGGGDAAKKDADAAERNAEKLAATRTQIARRRAELRERIDRLDRAIRTNANVGPAVELDLEHLRRLDVLLMQHEAAVEFLAEGNDELDEWRNDLEQLRVEGIDEARPYPKSLQDETEDQLDAEETRLRAAEADLATAKQLLAAAQEEHETCQRERRRVLDEEVEDESDKKETAALALRRKEAELACATAAELVALRRAELDVKTNRRAICEARHAYYDAKSKLIVGHVIFREEEMQEQLRRIRAAAADLNDRRSKLEQRLASLTVEESATHARLATEKPSEELLEEVQTTFHFLRRALHERLAMLDQRVAEASRVLEFIEWRHQVLNDKATLDDLQTWRDSLDAYLEQLGPMEATLNRRIEELRLDLSTYRSRLRKLDNHEEQLRDWIEAQVAQTNELAEDCEFGIVQLKELQRALRRVVREIEARLPSEESSPLRERFVAWMDDIWSYELAAVDDRPITIGKVLGALTYLVVGIFLARIVSHIAGRRLLPRVGMDRGASLAVQSITFYLLCAVGGFLALEFAHLPLTAFTFLGGAAAIGVGFGSQNILNNFISGLILLAEQPIRVGDVVELNSTYGTVEHIGLRSTRVRTGANFELIVPNSKLLENNVVNLTLSDNSIRTKVTLTAAYNSPASEVRTLLEEVALRNPRVLRDPSPTVLITNFASGGLELELHFSICIQSFGEVRVIESEVREAIESAFQEELFDLAGATRRPKQAANSGRSFARAA